MSEPLISSDQMRTIGISTRNDMYQVLCSLRDNRRKRAKRGEIFIEGVAPINAFAAVGGRATAVVYRDRSRLSGWARDIIRKLQPETAYELSPPLMAELSSRSDPSEIIVVAPRPSRTLGQLSESGTSPVYVVVDRPSNHGNLGSLMRTCDAFGIQGILTTGHGVDNFDPHVIRASLGACFYLPVVHEPSTSRLLDWVFELQRNNRRLQVVGTDSEADLPLAQASLRRPAVVMFGNEATGLSANLGAAVDRMVRIPMMGRVNSLNLTCAATVVLYQLCFS
jgi:TrmH family RNA methyltransferase